MRGNRHRVGAEDRTSSKGLFAPFSHTPDVYVRILESWQHDCSPEIHHISAFPATMFGDGRDVRENKKHKHQTLRRYCSAKTADERFAFALSPRALLMKWLPLLVGNTVGDESSGSLMFCWFFWLAGKHSISVTVRNESEDLSLL